MHFHSTFPSTSVTDLKAFAKLGKISPKAPQTPFSHEILSPGPAKTTSVEMMKVDRFLIPSQRKIVAQKKNPPQVYKKSIIFMCSFAVRS